MVRQIIKKRNKKPYQKRGPMQQKLLKNPMMVDRALTPLNYACYDFTYVQDLYYGVDGPAGGREYNIAFARFQPAGLTSSVYSFNSSPKWAVVSPNWEQLAVTDVRITFQPSTLVGYIDNSQIVKEEGITHTLEVYEDINTYNTPGFNANQARAVECHQLMDPGKGFTIYRDNRKLANQMRLPWAKVEDISAASYIDPHPRGSINLRFNTNGMSGGARFGTVKVTYKIHFRGQRL